MPVGIKNMLLVAASDKKNEGAFGERLRRRGYRITDLRMAGGLRVVPAMSR
jgi:hypothetical protein